MYPQIIPGLPLHTYGLCMAVGFFLAWKLVERLSGRTDLSNLVFILLFSGIAGGRIAHVIEYWGEGFGNDPFKIFKVWEGGLVFYGGLLGAIAAFVIWSVFSRRTFRDTVEIADALALGVPLGHAFGRIGCFCYGCCWGHPSLSAFAVRFPLHSPAGEARPDMLVGKSVPLLPVQLFEAAALLALLAVLVYVYRRHRDAIGRTVGAYLTGYGVIRFALEFLRDDDRPDLAGLSSAQLMSIILFALGLAAILYSFRRYRR